jgi:hypothetical protein
MSSIKLVIEIKFIDAIVDRGKASDPVVKLML